MKKSSAQRDKVVFISLVDILLQLTFVLLIVVIFIYKEYDVMVIRVKDFEKNNAEASTCVAEKNQCQLELSDLKKLYLQACIPLSKTRADTSILFTAKSTGEVIFEKFTDKYYAYLEARGDKTKMDLARSIKQGTTFNVKDVESKFSFVREADCFHEYYLRPIQSLNAVEHNEASGKLSRVFKALKE